MVFKSAGSKEESSQNARQQASSEVHSNVKPQGLTLVTDSSETAVMTLLFVQEISKRFSFHIPKSTP
jgi:hypothetical protein